MSKAEELLSTLTTSNVTTRLAYESQEPHIIIGEDRNVIVPDELKRLAVQFDHNIETVTFDCPRYWDEHDMSTMTVYINYLRTDYETGTYKAENLTVDESDPNIMHFDWTISRNVSEVYGQIVFIVCIKKTDEDGIESNHWNSELCKSCYVSEGLEVDTEAIKEIYPDIIEVWNREVLEAIDDVMAAKKELIDDVNATKQEFYTLRDEGEFDGATFIPSVATNGDISWTNNKGKPNPSSVNIMGPRGYCPVLTVTDIQGGHRITISDVEGTKYVDVMDTIINNAESVREVVNDAFYIGPVEPSNPPVLWFNTSEDGDI